MNVKRLIEMGSYRGLRHRRGLPVRGQRTHTNARTRKGPRRGTVANKKKAGNEVRRHGESTCKDVQRRKLSRRKRRSTYLSASCTCRRRSTTRSSPSPIRSATSFPGPVPVRSVSADRAKALRSRRSRRRLTAANKAKEAGMRAVEVRVAGPGSGRESAVRALVHGRHRSSSHSRRHADSAQRMPSAETSPRLICRMLSARLETAGHWCVRHVVSRKKAAPAVNCT